MTNEELIQKIRAEIERLNLLVPYDGNDRHDDGLHDAYHAILSFLSTIELEEYVELSSSVDNYPKNVCPPSVECEKGMREPLESEKPNDLEERWDELQTNFREINEAFEAGKKEQREQMLKEAVEGEVMLNPYPTICLDDCKDYDFKEGDKVRVIVIPNTDEK